MQPSQLQDRIAVVTGASRGIGRAVVERLATAGATVVAVARTKTALDELAAAAAGRVDPFAADITDPRAVAALGDHVLGRYGRIDLLINNAGVGHYAPVDELDPEQWDQMMAVNLKGAFLCCRTFVPAMKQRRSGHIINVASVAGLVTFPGGSGYCASKWGMIALTETLMQELKPFEIKVSAICPGSVQTGFAGRPVKDYSLRPGDVADLVATVAAQPAGVIVNQLVVRPLVPQAYRGLASQ